MVKMSEEGERRTWATHQEKLDRLAVLIAKMHVELEKQEVALEKLKGPQKEMQHVQEG